MSGFCIPLSRDYNRVLVPLGKNYCVDQVESCYRSFIHILNVQSTYFCELSCMALCNFTLLMFCLLLEIWCRFQFSHSRLASWNTSYRNLQNVDRDTVKMSTISARLCPQCCPRTSHDESGHTSVEALMWR